MAFTVDHKAVNEYDLKPEGEYEVIIEKMKPSFTRKNTPCINFVLAIRTDTDNPVKGGKLFDSLYKKKDPSQADLAVDGYSAAQLQRWCKAARIENGRQFASMEELCQALVGAPVRVTVKHEEAPGYPKRERVSFPTESKFPNVQTTAPAGFTELPPADPADDVPF